MGVSIPITAIKLKHRERIEQMRLAAGTRDTGRTDQQDARIEAVEDRLRVLERIVTDRSYDLATSIEALRDDRPMPAHLPERGADMMGPGETIALVAAERIRN